LSLDGLAPSPQLKKALDTALRLQRADGARIGRALRALPAGDVDVSPGLFVAIASAYRNALASTRQLRALADENAASSAVAVFATQATALEAWYEALRPGVPAQTSQRYATRAAWHFDAAATAFLRLDEEIGCPYGCKEPT
jgi:hypothetical protein